MAAIALILAILALVIAGWLYDLLRQKRRRDRRRRRRLRHMVHQQLWSLFMVKLRLKRLGQGQAARSRAGRS